VLIFILVQTIAQVYVEGPVEKRLLLAVPNHLQKLNS